MLYGTFSIVFYFVVGTNKKGVSVILTICKWMWLMQQIVYNLLVLEVNLRYYLLKVGFDAD